MKKILFISDYILQEKNGASQLAKAHLNLLINKSSFNKVDVIALTGSYDVKVNEFKCFQSHNNKFTKFINLIQGNTPSINNNIIRKIIEIIKIEKYDLIFIDNSIYGNLVKKIKKYDKSIKIISFYHDVKKFLSKQFLKEYKAKYLLEYLATIRNEKANVKYCDINITLNSRESNLLYKCYNKKSDLEIPICLKDEFKFNNIESKKDEYIILFIGAYYFPNVKGILWFVDNVMNRIDKSIKLYIVGKDMEKINSESSIINNNSVKVIGTVENLQDWYSISNMVIAPIFEGAGMKVKTAEALMNGKIILGTNEAFIGYEGMEEFLCNTADEFIDKINYYRCNVSSKYYENSRKKFMEKYSLDSNRIKLNECINKLF